jgi:endonuclease I
MTMKRRFFSIAFILVFAFSAFSQIPTGYYTNAEGKTGAALKTALYNTISSHTDVGYDGLYNVYTTSDNLLSGKVWDMYSIKADGSANYFYSHTSGDRCGSYNSEGDCYNREHTFCDSWLGKASPQRSDAHHILPTDGYVNNRRGSYPHGKVGTVSWTSSNGSKLGTSDPAAGYSGIVFEPIDEFKGDFARMYFYVVTCYENKVAGWASNGSAGDLLDGTTFPAFKSWFKTLMLQWNAQDPVSQKEIDRNNAIYVYQHNRNPFIDHPEYAEAVWGTGTVALNFTSSAITSATLNQAYSYAISVTGPVGSSFTITAPTKPDWLTFTSTGNTTATLSGTPTATGLYDVTLSVTDGASTKTQSFAIEVAALEGLKFTSTPATTATSGSPYSYSVTTSDAAHISATISLTATTKPAWLTLTSTGNGTATLSGTPSAGDAGSNSVTLSANDGFTTVTQSYAITVSVTGTTNTETFTNIGASSSAYATFPWTGDDGSTWNAASARTDQVITSGNKAICLKNTPGTNFESGTINGGCGSVTFKTLQVFTGTGGTLTLYINGTQVGSSFSYSTTQQTATFSNINIEGPFVIKIVNNGSARPIIDDVVWTNYTPTPNILPSITSISINPSNPVTDQAVKVSATITDSDGTIQEAYLMWGTTSVSKSNKVSMTLNGASYEGIIPAQGSAGTIYYTVSAKDNSGDIKTSDENTFSVIAANVSPTISDITISPSAPLTGQEVTLAATINDPDGVIEDAWLRWGTSSSALTNQLTMSMVDNKYQADIPAQTQAGTIYLAIYSRDDFGAETSSLYSYVVSQNQLPSITNISWTPQNPLTVEDITISATIADSDGSIQEAYLNWGTVSGNLATQVPMSLNNGKYECVIPFQSQVETIYFMVSGKDNLGVVGSSTQQSFSISAPNVLPSITNIENNPQNPLTGQAVTVSATITDSDGTIQEAYIMWGNESGSLTNEVSMSLVDGNYRAEIPSQLQAGTLYLSINAKDNLDSISTVLYSVVITANQAPSISNITKTPQTPLTGQAVIISANISDSDGSIQQTWVKWGVTLDELNNDLPMTLDGDVYKTTIPSQSLAGAIFLSISAKDNLDIISTELYSFTIAQNQSPVITNITKTPQTPLTGEPVGISANITDSDGLIQQAWINWGTSAENLVNNLTMALDGDVYKATIPSQSQAGTIYFSISAKDNLDMLSIELSSYLVSLNTYDNYKKDDSRIKVYPNPAKNQIYVEAMGVKANKLTISNIIGEKLVSIPFNGSKQPIDISHLKPGIYFVIVSGDDFRSTTRIVIY